LRVATKKIYWNYPREQFANIYSCLPWTKVIIISEQTPGFLNRSITCCCVVDWT